MGLKGLATWVWGHSNMGWSRGGRWYCSGVMGVHMKGCSEEGSLGGNGGLGYCLGSEEDARRDGSRKKRAAWSSIKQMSPKKQKENDQESVNSDKELRECLKVVLNNDKAIDYKTLDVKSLIVDYESQLLTVIEAGDVHVYKLIILNGSFRHFLTFSEMLEVLNRPDVLDCTRLL
nr:hypothetical protein [Tanacetum cinerariifolium]